MPESNISTIITLGCLGGLIPDILRIIKGRYEEEFPKYLHHLNFWFGLIMLVLLGGLAAFLLEASDAKQALAYGFAAPELFSKLLSTRTSNTIYTQSSGNADESVSTEREYQPDDKSKKVMDFTLREWWAS